MDENAGLGAAETSENEDEDLFRGKERFQPQATDAHAAIGRGAEADTEEETGAGDGASHPEGDADSTEDERAQAAREQRLKELEDTFEAMALNRTELTITDIVRCTADASKLFAWRAAIREGLQAMRDEHRRGADEMRMVAFASMEFGKVWGSAMATYRHRHIISATAKAATEDKPEARAKSWAQAAGAHVPNAGSGRAPGRGRGGAAAPPPRNHPHQRGGRRTAGAPSTAYTELEAERAELRTNGDTVAVVLTVKGPRSLGWRHVKEACNRVLKEEDKQKARPYYGLVDRGRAVVDVQSEKVAIKLYNAMHAKKQTTDGKKWTPTFVCYTRGAKEMQFDPPPPSPQKRSKPDENGQAGDGAGEDEDEASVDGSGDEEDGPRSNKPPANKRPASCRAASESKTEEGGGGGVAAPHTEGAQGTGADGNTPLAQAL